MKTFYSVLVLLFILHIQTYSQFAIEWENRTDGVYGNFDNSDFMKVDADGNVFVAGRSRNSSFVEDAVLIKYSSAGDLLWQKTENIGGYDLPIGIEFDDAGNCFFAFTGQSDTNSWGERDFILMKYDSDGNEIFRKQLNYYVAIPGGQRNVLGHAKKMVKDGFNNLVLFGVGIASWFVKLDYQGEFTHKSNFELQLNPDLPYYDQLNIMFDPISNKHYAGFIKFNNTGPGYKSVFQMVKINNAGEIEWEKQFYEFPLMSMYATVEGAEFRYDGGAIFSIDLNMASGPVDVVRDYPHLLSVNSGGEIIFDEELPVLPGDNTETAFSGTDLDQGGNIWVTGDQDYKYFVARYSAAGEKLWEVMDTTLHKGLKIACDGYTGTVASMDATGNVYFKKYDFNGDLLASHKVEGSSNIDGVTITDLTNDNNNYYFLGNIGGNNQDFLTLKFYDEATSVIEETNPEGFKVFQNYPNPFNPSTTIIFSLAEKSNVNISVYDILGKEIANLVSGEIEAGNHELGWNGAGFASGIYFCVINNNGSVEIIKMTLMK